ncbi:alkaline phosphatase family protein [Methanolobus chelungpuianus]|uniref:PKD domain-containing protein n=1 Tax=Methanolobus chelungpuianus TaxID=502115 RepID=A0AAE3H964_9EURY|nr:alkaline phosphatase family protein [Methanolobus chelungpuianus]MCQ6962291.1 hypothetical protein [Methanolobus chelungpuianus]
MKQKTNSDFKHRRCIEICILIALILLCSAIPAFAAEDTIDVNIIAPTQVAPGSLLKVRVSIFNTQELPSLQAESMSIEEQINNQDAELKSEKKKITIKEIDYENPFQLVEEKTVGNKVSDANSKDKQGNDLLVQSFETTNTSIFSISKPKPEKKSVNQKLEPIGNTLKIRNNLNEEFNAKIKKENLSTEQIEYYVDLDKKLQKMISKGKTSIVLEVPVPDKFPEGEILTIPVDVVYSTESSATETISTLATVTVTSNPVPKRAIIIDIDGLKRDALYNSLSDMPNMSVIADNGVRFTDAKTVFPSVTLATQASIFTGNYPKQHEIAGNRWFEKSSRTYRDYWLEVWYDLDFNSWYGLFWYPIWTEGTANKDLSSDVDTIYEAASSIGMDSTIIYNHYGRHIDDVGDKTKWVKPLLAGWYHYDHQHDKEDEKAISAAMCELDDHAPSIFTIYLPGLDGYSHYYGSNGVDPYNQEYYLKNHVDIEVGRLLYGGECDYFEYYDGLIDSGLMYETLFIVVSDHGHISVDNELDINKTELENTLTIAGFITDDEEDDSDDYDATAAPNGGMAQIYIRDTDTNDWNDQPELDDLLPALDAYKSHSYVDVILVRYSGSNGYRVYTGDGNTQDLKTFFAGKTDYVDAVNRINGLNSARSGDIVLLANSADGWYFDNDEQESEHGGLSPDESYIPLIFSGPTIRKGVDTTPASNIDMATTIADLLGFSMPKADGKVLPVQDSFGYRVKDSNTYGGPDYDWIEISQTGTGILADSDDGIVSNIDIGFFFNYYGTDYSRLGVANNGLLFSGATTSTYVNEPIGQSASAHGFISPYWDDLVTWEGGRVYYQTLGTAPNRIFVVEWVDNQHYSSSTSGITFEAILYEGSNNIRFQYKDVDFGSVYWATSYDRPPYNKGGSATVGIESPDGNGGIQYSYNKQVINPELAILFKFPQYAGTNLYLSAQAPVAKDRGSNMTYRLYYHNFGDSAAQNAVLTDSLPSQVEFISASGNGIYSPVSRKITWSLGTIGTMGCGYETVTVRIPESVDVGAVLLNHAEISASNIEVRYDDNEFETQTKITGSPLPANVRIEPVNFIGNTQSVYWGTPVTFSYLSCESATGVDITIHVNDGGSDITGSMAGGPERWKYTTTFYPRHGYATVTYQVHGCENEKIVFNLYIDPAGCVYDVATGQRIEGAAVWLQRPDGEGGWENVPTGLEPPISQPDINPLITDENGMYQWDVLEGSYRVHVEASGYYPADSIVVSIPPPVTDLHIGLTALPSANHPPVANASGPYIGIEGHSISFNASSSYDPDGNEDIVSYEWDFDMDGIADSTGMEVAHMWDDDHNGQVSLKVTDSNGASTTNITNVTVLNALPVVDCSNFTVQWGDTMTLSGNSTDPGNDSWSCEINWGDGSPVEPGTMSGNEVSGVHMYSTPGEYETMLKVLDDDGGLGSASSHINVSCRTTRLEYIGNLTAQYSDNTTLKAQLNDYGNSTPLSGKPINFILGDQTVTAVTGTDGVASAALKIDQSAGNYNVQAEFAGDSHYSADRLTESFSISHEDAAITYTGDMIVPVTSSSVDLRATLEETDTDYGDLTQVKVNFTIYKSSDATYSNPITTVPAVALVTVTSSGMGVGTAKATINNLPADDYMIIARIVSDGYYSPTTSAPALLTVYEPTGQFTTGGGWILDPTGSHGNFGFTAKYNNKGNVQGNSVYIYHQDGLDYIIKSNAWIGLAITGATSRFQGKASLQIYDSTTGLLQPESSGNFQFIVEAVDNESSGTPDSYYITVLDKNGVVYHTASGQLQGGNIVIHEK